MKTNILKKIAAIFCILVLIMISAPVYAGQNSKAGCAVDMNIYTNNYADICSFHNNA